MKIALITAITGGMDDWKDIPEQSVAFTQHRYTDEHVPEQYQCLNQRTRALYFKQQMHEYLPGYDVYIWVDGKVQILAYDFVEQCIKALGDGDLAILRHGSRSSCREEVEYITNQIAKGDKYLSTRYAHRDLPGQLKIMQDNGYPDDRGLNDCSIIAVRNNNKTKNVFNGWWTSCKYQGWFDQIAIQLAAWICGVTITPIDFKPASFKLVKHKVCR